jgi:hypothetical protein
MKEEELSRIIRLLDAEATPDRNDDAFISGLRAAYDFSPGFTASVMQKLAGQVPGLYYESILLSMNSLFMRVVVTGIAAVILLAVSVFMSGGDFSFETLLGLGNTTEEGMISLLSGNY